MRVYLIGFMGAGKSTIGKLFAEELKCPFIDLDQEVEHSESQTVAEIFATRGETYFRQVESRLLKSIAATPVVIATGGGCFIHNQDWMLMNGTVVYLEVPFEEIVERIGGDPARPLWKNAETLYAGRIEVYRTAHFTVNGSGTPEEVVKRLTALSLPESKRNQES